MSRAKAVSGMVSPKCTVLGSGEQSVRELFLPIAPSLVIANPAISQTGILSFISFGGRIYHSAGGGFISGSPTLVGCCHCALFCQNAGLLMVGHT